MKSDQVQIQKQTRTLMQDLIRRTIREQSEQDHLIKALDTPEILGIRAIITRIQESSDKLNQVDKELIKDAIQYLGG